jgi:hypothetical protein
MKRLLVIVALLATAPAYARGAITPQEKEWEATLAPTEAHYANHFLDAGYLLRAAAVCEAEKHRTVNAAFHAMMATPDIKRMAQAYPEFLKRWMEYGGENFNDDVMKHGVTETCNHVGETRERAEQNKEE